MGIVTLLVAAAPGAALLQDWYVDVSFPLCPGGNGTEDRPFCHIMDAVAVAEDGDTIHIAPGTYVENVVIDGDLTLIGTGGQAATILDGSASGSVVRIEGDGSSVALIGLTLTNGVAPSGGGLHCTNLSEGPITTVHLRDCSVVGNSAEVGGGISVGIETTVTLTRTTVSGNVADGNAGLGTGGGIYVWGTAGGIIQGPGSITLTDSMVSGNTATGAHAFGGGIAGATGSVMTLTGTILRDNTAAGLAAGGGISGGGCRITIQNSTLSGNSAAGSEVYGGGIWGYGCDITIQGSTLSENTAAGSSYAEGGAILAAEGYLTITNSVLWDNGPDSLTLYGTPSVSVGHSIVEGGWPGAGNLDADPLFVDSAIGDLRLSPGSPCIDAGDTRAVPLGLWTDLDGKLRFLDDPATSDTGLPRGSWPIVDMGAYEFGVEPPRKVRRR